MNNRNNQLQKITKRDNRISHGSNSLDLSVSKIAEDLNQKMSYVKMNIEKQNKVFINKIRNSKKEEMSCISKF